MDYAIAGGLIAAVALIANAAVAIRRSLNS